MKKLTAIYKDENKNLRSRVDYYRTKKEYKSDMIANGLYPVIAILTDNQIEQIKNGELNNSFINLDFEFVKQCL